MSYKKQNKAFTLTEVLISAGILAIGFMIIAMAFPVGVKLTSLATERTIGTVATQEAIAKMRLHRIDMSYWDTYFVDTVAPNDGLTYGNCFEYSEIERLDWSAVVPLPSYMPMPMSKDECYYPSTNLPADKKYHWSALCRRIGVAEIQVTVFISRLGGTSVQYPSNPIPNTNLIAAKPTTLDYPEPYMVLGLDRDATDADRLTVPAGFETYFREGASIVDDLTGDIYTIQERLSTAQTILLDKDWPYPSGGSYSVWVLPSAIKSGSTTTPLTLSGRWPCVWVSQHTIKF